MEVGLPRTKSASCCAHGAIPSGTCRREHVLPRASPNGEELTREKSPLIRACEDYLHDLIWHRCARAWSAAACISRPHPQMLPRLPPSAVLAVDDKGKTPLPTAIESAARAGLRPYFPEVTPLHSRQHESVTCQKGQVYFGRFYLGKYRETVAPLAPI